MRNIICTVFFIVLTSYCYSKEKSKIVSSTDEHLMWNRYPAKEWVEAFPVGNGSMGAMVFGRTRVERIQINEETIWSGTPKPRKLAPDYAERKARARQLIFDGKQAEAEKLIHELKTEQYDGDDAVIIEGATTTEHGYETAGDIFLYFDAETEQETNYRRQLDIQKGLASTDFNRAGIEYSREVLCSYPDKVLAIRLKSSKAGKLSFLVKLTRPLEANEQLGNFFSPPKKLKAVNPVITEALGDDHLRMKGQASNLGAKFEVHLKAVPVDGTCERKDKGLQIENCSEVVLYVHITSDYYGSDLSQHASAIINKAVQKGYDAIKKAHVADVSSLFDRVEFRLGKRGTSYPLDVRMRNIRNRIEDPRYYHGQLTDPGLISLFYQFNRYLLIASSREGTLPPALHYWNNSLYPAWYGRPTTNVNQQMNYWGVEVANLSECHLPMLKLLEDYLPAGREVAEKAYKSIGAVFPGRGIAITHAPEFIYDTWNDAGGWFSSHFFDHYLFSMDRAYLSKHAYPYMKDMTLFYLDNLVEHPTDGYLVTGPSYSAEMGYRLDGKTFHYANGVTLSKGIINETLKNTLKAAIILNVDKTLQRELAAAIPRLSPYKVSERFSYLQEWDEDVEGSIPGHRHLSFLYPIYPGYDILKKDTLLFKAAERGFHDRLDRGSGWTGWSRAWCIALAARFGDGNLAGEQLEWMMRGQIYPNLLGTHKRGGHDLYVMDGNFGTLAGISEMLLQSHQGYIELLPALPPNWGNGSIKGLCARGGFVVDIYWENGELKRATIHSKSGNLCKIKYGEIISELETKESGIYTLNSELHKN